MPPTNVTGVPLVTGPVVMRVAGDVLRDPCRIGSIVWEGATIAGDRVEFVDPVSGTLLHAMRTPDTHTYIGVSFQGKGLGCPNGFQLRTCPTPAQTIQVYLTEL
jgi:hypothetical protein